MYLPTVDSDIQSAGNLIIIFLIKGYDTVQFEYLIMSYPIPKTPSSTPLSSLLSSHISPPALSLSILLPHLRLRLHLATPPPILNRPIRRSIFLLPAQTPPLPDQQGRGRQKQDKAHDDISRDILIIGRKIKAQGAVDKRKDDDGRTQQPMDRRKQRLGLRPLEHQMMPRPQNSLQQHTSQNDQADDLMRRVEFARLGIGCADIDPAHDGCDS